MSSTANKTDSTWYDNINTSITAGVNSATGWVSDTVSSGYGTVKEALGGTPDPTTSRLNGTGLMVGGDSASAATASNPTEADMFAKSSFNARNGPQAAAGLGTAEANLLSRSNTAEYKADAAARNAELGKSIAANAVRAAESDWRVRISCPPNAPYFYKDQNNTIMSPLIATSGAIFPNTPRITMTHNANYETVGPTHSNYPIHTYKNSSVTIITVAGDYTAQTREEADYVLACIMFFRSATKMFWGKDTFGGNPPPVLFLDGYGKHYFPHVPVVVKSFTNDINDEADFIESSHGGTRIPSFSTLTITLEPVYSRRKIHTEFTLEAYSKGALSGLSNGGFI